MRALRPILALVFLFAVHATAAGWRQCPHHDAVAPEHAAPAHHDGHTGDVPAAPEHDDGPCSCLSGAQCAIPLALHASADVQVVAANTVVSSGGSLSEHQTPARIPSLYLPEATAPPATL